MLRIKPGAAGCEARILPLCYAAPHSKSKFIEEPFFAKSSEWNMIKESEEDPKGGWRERKKEQKLRNLSEKRGEGISSPPEDI